MTIKKELKDKLPPGLMKKENSQDQDSKDQDQDSQSAQNTSSQDQQSSQENGSEKDQNSGSDTEKDQNKEEVRNWDEVKKIISERNEFKKKSKVLDDELRAIRAERQSIEEAKTAELRAKELENLEKNGQYKKALAKVIEEKDTEKNALLNKIIGKVVPNAIATAALKIPDLDPNAVEDLQVLLGNKIKVDLTSLEAYVSDEKGNPLKNEMLEPVGVEDFVKEFVKARPRYIIDKQVKNSGLKPGPLKGKENNRSLDGMSVDELNKWQKDDPNSYAAAISNKYFKNPKKLAEEILAKKGKS